MLAIKRSIIVLGLAVSLSACFSSTGKQPVWVTQPAAQYPEAQYLSATGSADQASDADTRALANLSRIFEVAIKDSAMDFSSATVTTQGGERQVSNDQRVARSVNTFANQVLEGAKVMEHWKEEGGAYYSVAVLEKAPAARRFRDEIRQMDKKTDDLVAYAEDKANNPATALSALEAARQLQIERAQLNRNLSVVAGAGLPAKVTADDLETSIREALAVLRFDVEANPAELLAGTQSAINQLGANYDERSAYVIKTVLDTEPLQEKQGWFWLRGSLEMSLIKNGEAQAKQRWPMKVSSTTRGMVQQRANDELAGKLPNYLFELMTSSDVPQ